MQVSQNGVNCGLSGLMRFLHEGKETMANSIATVQILCISFVFYSLLMAYGMQDHISSMPSREYVHTLV